MLEMGNIVWRLFWIVGMPCATVVVVCVAVLSVAYTVRYLTRR